MAGALDGIKVIEFSIGIQAPQSAMHLAEHGAEVIKIEPPTGETNRHHFGLGSNLPPGSPGSQFIAMNRGKRLMAIDAKSERGREVIFKLLENADVFMSNWREAALERLGLSYDELHKRFPRLIYATVNGFGLKGPDADRAMTDGVAQARGGLPYVTGSPDRPPMLVGAAIADTSGAVQLSVGILTALVARERTGIGQRVSTSSYASQLWLQAWELTHTGITGFVPTRVGSFHPLAAGGGFGCYETADGQAVALVDSLPVETWRKFCDYAGRPEIAEDERWDNPRKRIGLGDPTGKDAGALRPIMIEMMRTHTAEEWEIFFADPDFMFQRVFNYAEILEDPQALENGYVTEIDVANVGRIKTIANPITLSETPAEVKLLPTELGMHTEEILLEHGYDWEDIVKINEDTRNAERAAYEAAGIAR